MAWQNFADAVDALVTVYNTHFKQDFSAWEKDAQMTFNSSLAEADKLYPAVVDEFNDLTGKEKYRVLLDSILPYLSLKVVAWGDRRLVDAKAWAQQFAEWAALVTDPTSTYPSATKQHAQWAIDRVQTILNYPGDPNSKAPNWDTVVGGYFWDDAKPTSGSAFWLALIAAGAGIYLYSRKG